jgi:phage tail sheath gpL-like
VESYTTVIIPFNDDRVVFVSLLNCAKFSSRLSEVAKTLDAISGIQFLAGRGGFGKWWLLGAV